MGLFDLRKFILVLGLSFSLASALGFSLASAKQLEVLSEDAVSTTYSFSSEYPLFLPALDFLIDADQQIQILSLKTEILGDSILTTIPSNWLDEWATTSSVLSYSAAFSQQFKRLKDAKVHLLYKEEQNIRWVKEIHFVVPKRSNQLSPKVNQSSLTAQLWTNQEEPFENGRWFKIPILKDGIHQLNAQYLEQLGLNVNEIGPSDISLWSGSWRPLPFDNSENRPQLRLIPAQIEGESSSRLGSEASILFYADAASGLLYEDSQWRHQRNHYADTAFVFLGINTGLSSQNFEVLTVNAGNLQTTGRQIHWLEEELFKTEEDLKSGMNWLGQRFTPDAGLRQQVIYDQSFTGLDETKPVSLSIRAVVRSLQSSSIEWIANGSAVGQTFFSGIRSYTAADGRSATQRDYTTSIFADNSGRIQLQANVSLSISSAQAWIDYIRLDFEANLIANDGLLAFLPTPEQGGNTTYQVSGFDSQPLVLDLSNPQRPKRLSVSAQGNAYRFNANVSGQSLRFIAQDRFILPEAGYAMPNQRILTDGFYPSFVIITNRALQEAAEEFAAYRNANDPSLRAQVYLQEDIFNQFSGGKADPVAIRDFLRAKSFFAQQVNQETPQQVLFFGDATFDPKGIEGGRPLIDQVITFQTVESIDRIGSYGTDDFFGLLDDSEGPMLSNSERVDIGIGRFPVTNLQEGRILLDKIRRYESEASLGSWRQVFTFLADDELNGGENDGDLHVLNADGTAIRMDTETNGIRFNKIYLPSYPVVTTAEGRRVPGAKIDLLQAINNGSLVVNYSGHGAEQILTAERVFRSEDIPSLTNRNRPTIFVTATCSFGRYDDNADQSGAEKLLLYPDGGAIASFTTTRVVYTSSSTTGANNFSLNIALSGNMTQRDLQGLPLRLGEIYRRTKATSVGAATNSRKFILIGDPSMRMGLPSRISVPDQVNEVSIASDSVRLRGLDEVALLGNIRNASSQIDNGFDGLVSIEVYDAVRRVRMLQRVESSRACLLEDCSYDVQNDLLFTGTVRAREGRYEANFRLPKDLQNSSRNGRLSIYAQTEDGRITAGGSSNNLFFSGLNTEAPEDNQGPSMDIWLNEPSFVDGSITGTNPRLFVELEDDSGINTTASGIGHELTAILDTDPPQNFSLNRFYQGAIDNLTKGSIEFPLENLPEGRHKLSVRAWDIHNNLSEQSIDFEVLNNQALVVRNLYNYPNPMSELTRFVFEHNQSGQALDVSIRIFTLSGRPVSKLQQQLVPTGSYAMLEWDGKDQDGNTLANGTYLYHAKVRADGLSQNSTFEKIEKLVIIR